MNCQVYFRIYKRAIIISPRGNISIPSFPLAGYSSLLVAGAHAYLLEDLDTG